MTTDSPKDRVRQQVNVTLPADLVRAVKHAAIDDHFTLAAYVEAALRARVDRDAAFSARPAAFQLQPIVFVRDLATSVPFYRSLGFEVQAESRRGVWVELSGPAGTLALHETPDVPDLLPAGDVEPSHRLRVTLRFTVGEPLDDVRWRLAALGVAVGDVLEETFGRFMILTDPDGLPIEITEIDPESYL